MKIKPEKDPRRCADIKYISMYGGGVKCICKYFWWDCGPIDESGEIPGEYTSLMCMYDDKRLTMGIINHTALRGCCCWKPCFDSEEFEDDD